MKKLLLFALLILSLPAFGTTLTGTVNNPDGTSFSGTLVFNLSATTTLSTATLSSGYVCPGPLLVSNLNSTTVQVINGVMQSTVNLYDSECTQPAGIPYNVEFISQTGKTTNQLWVVTGTSENIGTIVPVTSDNIVFNVPLQQGSTTYPGGTNGSIQVNNNGIFGGATSAQLVSALNTSPTTQLVSTLIPTLNYLPLSGGTLTGGITLSAGNVIFTAGSGITTPDTQITDDDVAGTGAGLNVSVGSASSFGIRFWEGAPGATLIAQLHGNGSLTVNALTSNGIVNASGYQVAGSALAYANLAGTMPLPTATVPGGVLAATCSSGTFATGISTAGDPVCATPPSGSSNATALQGVAISTTAPTTGQLLQYNGTDWIPTAASASTATQRGVNAVTDEGFVAGGTTDNSAKLQAWLTGLTAAGAHELFVPCGVYLFAATSTTNANGVTIIGEATDSENANGCVVFEQNMSGPIIWFDGSGQQLQGPRIENISFKGSGVAGEVGLHFSDYQNMQLSNISFDNYTGTEYTTGTVSVTNGSTTVTGSGTTWTAAMVPGNLSVAGIFQQVCTFVSATSLTLCSAWQGATNSAASYALDNGIGLLMDGGVSFTQYGDVYNIRGFNNRIAVMSLGGTSTVGVSRVKFHSGNIQCNRVPDSMALSSGAFTDTLKWAVASNNCAVHVNIEESHAMDIRGGNFENDGTATVVPTCNGGTASQACMVGVYVNGAVTSDTYANVIAYNTFSGMGNAIQLGPNAYRTQIKSNVFTDYGNTNAIVLPGTGSTADKTTITQGSMPQYDRVGTITLASGSATHTFAGGPEGSAYPAAPYCMAVDITTPGTTAYATTTTTVLTLHGTGSDVVQWLCQRAGN